MTKIYKSAVLIWTVVLARKIVAIDGLKGSSICSGPSGPIALSNTVRQEVADLDVVGDDIAAMEAFSGDALFIDNGF